MPLKLIDTIFQALENLNPKLWDDWICFSRVLTLGAQGGVEKLNGVDLGANIQGGEARALGGSMPNPHSILLAADCYAQLK